MYKNAKRYKCGGCGNGKYKIYQVKKKIVTVCTKCKSPSEITIRPAELKVDWGEPEGEGCMTVWDK